MSTRRLRARPMGWVKRRRTMSDVESLLGARQVGPRPSARAPRASPRPARSSRPPARRRPPGSGSGAGSAAVTASTKSAPPATVMRASSASRKPATGGRHDRPADGLVLVELDRIEAVGERGHDVRHDEHVGVLQVADHLVAAARAEQQGAREAQQLVVAGGEHIRADQHEGRAAGPGHERGIRPERARHRQAQPDVDAVAMHGAEIERDRPVRQVARARGPVAGTRRRRPRWG